MLKALTSFIVFFFGGPYFLVAATLDDTYEMNNLRGKKVGYYIGSFDPMHLGHQHVIDKALKRGYVDYVLVFPVPGEGCSKNRNELTFRQKLIASVYQDNPKVLLCYSSPKELQDRFTNVAADVEIIGMIGSDVVTEKLMGPDAALSAKFRNVFMRGIPLEEKHFNDSVGAIMALKASSFLVALRGDIDLSYLDLKIYDRDIQGYILSDENSSTELRKAISEKREYEHLVAFSVQALIKQEGMYGFPSRFNVALQQELLEIQKKDQTLRMSLMGEKNLSQKEWEKISEMDVMHGRRLKEIIKQYGWPGVSDVGIEGATAMWLLVQHQDSDLDFQKECLSLLNRAVQTYESPMSHYAYLYDRVHMNLKLPQMYGTQWIQEDGKFIIYNVEDPDNLDKLRQEAGLCSISEYKEALKRVYQLTEENLS